MSKRFGVVRALHEVSLQLHPGEVHAIVGENGAGKSTLTKIIGGSLPPDSGELVYEGAPVVFQSPVDALGRGISTIFQELSLTPQMSVAANVFLGHEPVSAIGRLDRAQMRERTSQLLARLGATFSAGRLVRGLSTADQQLVEIAAALNRDAKLIMMDEPTASLPEESARRLFAIIQGLREDGVCVVYISHELDHVFQLSDRITVLKDGTHVATHRTLDTSPDEVITQMVGRSIGDLFPARSEVADRSGTPVLEVRGLGLEGYFEDISFDVYSGEVVGLAGLVGSGRTEVALSIFGAPPGIGGVGALRGTVRVDGREVRIRHPGDAIGAGIAYLPEERKTDGVALDLSITHNMVLPQLRQLARRGLTQPEDELEIARRQIAALALRCSSPFQLAGRLSGGNQQKVVLGKWLAQGCRVLILDDPTRGIDVGAKMEIYRLIRQLVEEAGLAVLLISSELPEILGLSDRVLIMRKGRLADEETRADASEEDVIRSAFGAASQERT